METGEDVRAPQLRVNFVEHDFLNVVTVISARLQRIRRRQSQLEPLPIWVLADLRTIETAMARLIELMDQGTQKSSDADFG